MPRASTVSVLVPTILGLGVPWHVEKCGLSLLCFCPGDVVFSKFGILSQPPVSPFSQIFGFLRRAVCIHGPETSVICSWKHSVLCFFYWQTDEKEGTLLLYSRIVYEHHSEATSWFVFLFCARDRRDACSKMGNWACWCIKRRISASKIGTENNKRFVPSCFLAHLWGTYSSCNTCSST